MTVLRQPRSTIAAAACLVLLASLCLLACGGSSAKPGAASSQASGALANYAWVVGIHGTILATTDGGAHWTRQNAGTTENLYGVAFADADHGWVIGNTKKAGIDVSVILGTSDGGRHWTRVFRFDAGRWGGLGDVACAGANHVWAVGSGASGGGLILASSDGGATWQMQQPVDLSRQGVWRVAFVDADRGWACTNGTGARMLQTSDGGAHWQVDKALPGAGDIAALAPVGSSTCWAFGDRTAAGQQGEGPALLVADQHGATWKPDPNSTDPVGVVAMSESHVGLIALGGMSSCAFSSSSDDGSHWTAPIDSLPIDDFTAAAFSDTSHGWAVGVVTSANQELILRTTDGGQTWQKTYSGSADQELFDIACPGSIGGTSVGQ
jgi:photosystem II stability/assembly factor-like uncharacterized protein